ncbi:MAG: hypothetical protein WAM82_16945 [Thermoanaerobaculia bacterium]
MVLKAFKNQTNQCQIAKNQIAKNGCQDPCTPEQKIKNGCDVGYPVIDIESLWKANGVQAQPHSAAVNWDDLKKELEPQNNGAEPGRPVEIFLGLIDTNSKDGHLVLIVGAEETASGRRAVSVADPASINYGISPTDFDSLEADLGYGKWNRTWTNLFWKGP